MSDNICSFLGRKLIEKLVDEVDNVCKLGLVDWNWSLASKLSQNANNRLNHRRWFVWKVSLEKRNNVGKLCFGLDKTNCAGLKSLEKWEGSLAGINSFSVVFHCNIISCIFINKILFSSILVIWVCLEISLLMFEFSLFSFFFNSQVIVFFVVIIKISLRWVNISLDFVSLFCAPSSVSGNSIFVRLYLVFKGFYYLIEQVVNFI